MGGSTEQVSGDALEWELRLSSSCIMYCVFCPDKLGTNQSLNTWLQICVHALVVSLGFSVQRSVENVKG